MVHCVESERAQIGEGLARAWLSCSRAAPDCSNKMGRERKAAINTNGGRDGAASVDHLVEGLLCEDRKSVPLHNAESGLKKRWGVYLQGREVNRDAPHRKRAPTEETAQDSLF
jgi:hypothetical protein